MKKLSAFLVLVMLICTLLPVLHAEATMNVSCSACTLQVSAIDIITRKGHTIVRSTGSTNPQQNVNSIEFQYDFETQQAEFVGRFRDDAPIALVYVGGFSDELAFITDPDLVILTVNGQPLEVDENVKYAESIGWQNAKNVLPNGRRCLVFPIELTRQGSVTEYSVSAESVINGVRVKETFDFTVKLTNTHEYKDERTASIASFACSNADVYRIGDRIYLDRPRTASGETCVEITFADENGLPFTCITWADQTTCEKEGQSAALYLAESCKLKDSAAKFKLDNAASPSRRREVVFHLETQNAQYATEKYTIIERYDVEPCDPKGIYFAQTEKTMTVGSAYEPIVLSIATEAAVRTNPAGTLEILAGENTAQQVIDVSDGKTVLATKPGVAYITARYTMGSTVYESSSMKITVTGSASKPCEPYYVLCRNLNVRSDASLDSAKVGMFHRGDEVQILSIVDGWALTAQGTYLSAQYLSK